MGSRRVAAGLAVLALLPLAACTPSNGTHPTAGGSATDHRSVQPGASPTTSPAHRTRRNTGSSTPTAPASTSPSQPTAECGTAHLDARLSGRSGAAGSTYVHLVLTNTGPEPCVTAGYPGVSYVAKGGSQLGAAARREAAGSVRRITLAPGDRVASTVREVETANFDPAKCRPARFVALRVYPPDQTSSLLVKTSGTGCRNRKIDQLSVRPLRPLH